MQKVPLFISFCVGLGAGFLGATFLYSKYYQDELVADKITALYLPIKEFVALNELSEKQVYCVKLFEARSNAKYLSGVLGEVEKRYMYSTALEMVTIFAKESVTEFEKIDVSTMKYDCEKT